MMTAAVLCLMRMTVTGAAEDGDLWPEEAEGAGFQTEDAAEELEPVITIRRVEPEDDTGSEAEAPPEMVEGESTDSFIRDQESVESREDRSEKTYTVENLNIPVDDTYFNGHFYYFFSDLDGSWTDAKAFCFIYGGHLVTINSAEEQAFLESQYPGTSGWIGAYEEDGTWKWTTGEPFLYTNWKAGEPNNQNGNEGYGHLYTDMQWNDLPEEDATYHKGFYCEWDTDVVTYERDGVFGGEILPETAELLEKGKGYFYGTGAEGFDMQKAWECFYDATDDYSGEAWYYLGRILAGGQRSLNYPYTRALGAYERAIAYGCQKGWIGMGDLYLSGQGVPIDYWRAIQYFQRAAGFGCEEADCYIGYVYECGLGVEQDFAAAALHYQKGAENGDPMAMYYLGRMYEEGKGVPMDYSTAEYWYEQALASPYLSINIKEGIGETLPWLTSEDYEDYAVG